VTEDRIIAVGLLTERDLDRLGDTFTRLWPVDDVPSFEELLAAIDEVDRGAQFAGAGVSRTKEQ
jgi:hypothetical protein